MRKLGFVRGYMAVNGGRLLDFHARLNCSCSNRYIFSAALAIFVFPFQHFYVVFCSVQNLVKGNMHQYVYTVMLLMTLIAKPPLSPEVN